MRAGTMDIGFTVFHHWVSTEHVCVSHIKLCCGACNYCMIHPTAYPKEQQYNIVETYCCWFYSVYKKCVADQLITPYTCPFSPWGLITSRLRNNAILSFNKIVKTSGVAGRVIGVVVRGSKGHWPKISDITGTICIGYILVKTPKRYFMHTFPDLQ